MVGEEQRVVLLGTWCMFSGLKAILFIAVLKSHNWSLVDEPAAIKLSETWGRDSTSHSLCCIWFSMWKIRKQKLPVRFSDSVYSWRPIMAWIALSTTLLVTDAKSVCARSEQKAKQSYLQLTPTLTIESFHVFRVRKVHISNSLLPYIDFTCLTENCCDQVL